MRRTCGSERLDGGAMAMDLVAGGLPEMRPLHGVLVLRWLAVAGEFPPRKPGTTRYFLRPAMAAQRDRRRSTAFRLDSPATPAAIAGRGHNQDNGFHLSIRHHLNHTLSHNDTHLPSPLSQLAVEEAHRQSDQLHLAEGAY